jgi:hypothetical protein
MPRTIARDTLLTILLPLAHTYDVGRAITTLIKIYDNKSKYYSSTNILDTKLIVFYDLCSKAGVRDTNWSFAFLVILVSDAKEFYYKNIINRKLDFLTTIALVQENFKTQERQQRFISH